MKEEKFLHYRRRGYMFEFSVKKRNYNDLIYFVARKPILQVFQNTIYFSLFISPATIRVNNVFHKQGNHRILRILDRKVHIQQSITLRESQIFSS